jgi:hypothetical protein
MKEFVSCSIWNCGPGRPWDNSWKVNKIIFNKDNLRLYLNEKEIITILNPKGIHFMDLELIIEDADEITWDMFTYGSNNVHCITTYKNNNGTIYISDSLGKNFTHLAVNDYAFHMKGCFQNAEIIGENLIKSKCLLENEKILIFDDFLKIKNENIIIKIDNIDFLYYARRNLKNYFLAPFKYSPGYLYIFIKNNSIHRKYYRIKMAYSDVLKLPEKYKKLLDLIK